MFYRNTIVALVILLMLASGCSRRRTRQFIVADAPTQSYEAGQWQIDPPSVVAFKDIVDLKSISDTSMFWVSLRAKRLRASEAISGPGLRIDSVCITFADDTSRYWRKPTRVAPYDAPGDDYERKIFDFFGDQGIVIPAAIDTIIVTFEALVAPGGDQETERYPLQIRMVRDEKALRVPLLQE